MGHGQESTGNVSQAAPLYDRDAALKRLGGDQELFQKLIEFFLEDSRNLLEEIRSGMAVGEADRVETAAHTLKGLISNFDAEQATRAALELQQMAHAGRLAAAENAAEQLHERVHELSEALTRALGPAAANPGG